MGTEAATRFNGAVIMAQPLQEFTRFIWEYSKNTRQPQTKPISL